MSLLELVDIYLGSDNKTLGQWIAEKVGEYERAGKFVVYARVRRDMPDAIFGTGEHLIVTYIEEGKLWEELGRFYETVKQVPVYRELAAKWFERNTIAFWFDEGGEKVGPRTQKMDFKDIKLWQAGYLK